jgi:hypothetical protein
MSSSRAAGPLAAPRLDAEHQLLAIRRVLVELGQAGRQGGGGLLAVRFGLSRAEGLDRREAHPRLLVRQEVQERGGERLVLVGGGVLHGLDAGLQVGALEGLDQGGGALLLVGRRGVVVRPGARGQGEAGEQGGDQDRGRTQSRRGHGSLPVWS